MTVNIFDTISHSDFLQLVLEAFSLLGYKVESTPAQIAGGADALLIKGTGARIPVLCKKYRGAFIGRPVLQQFYDAMTRIGSWEGYLVTTTDCSPDALEFAKAKGIVLYNREGTLQLLRTAFGDEFIRTGKKTAAKGPANVVPKIEPRQQVSVAAYEKVRPSGVPILPRPISAPASVKAPQVESAPAAKTVREPERATEPEMKSGTESISAPKILRKPEIAAEPEQVFEPETASVAASELMREPEITSEPASAAASDSTAEPEMVTELEMLTDSEILSVQETEPSSEIVSAPSITPPAAAPADEIVSTADALPPPEAAASPAVTPEKEQTLQEKPPAESLQQEAPPEPGVESPEAPPSANTATIVCAECNHQLRVPTDQGMITVKCPECGMRRLYQPEMTGISEPKPTTIVTCQSCSQQLNVPTNRGQLNVRCPKCGDKWLFTP